MRKFFKWIGYLVIVVILLAVVGVSYITLALPDVGKPEAIKVDLTPARIARGEYLANHVTLCMDCHSKRDWSNFAGPTINSTFGGGGEVFDAKVGFPGEVHVPNITPHHLKDWTDGEIFRAITSGVRKDGSALFPLMPWTDYSKLDREDVYAIIAYLRTLKPIPTEYPRSKLNFPLNIIVHTMPKKATLSTLPNPADSLKYGSYVVQVSGCMDCHTQDKQGQPIAGLEFAGGHEYIVNGNTVRSSNITPDKETGIGTWTEAMFLAKFKSYSDPSKSAGVNKTDFQTIMPWYGYAGMTETDLKAMYQYLRTVKPISNKVVKFTVNSAAIVK